MWRAYGAIWGDVGGWGRASIWGAVKSRLCGISLITLKRGSGNSEHFGRHRFPIAPRKRQAPRIGIARNRNILSGTWRRTYDWGMRRLTTSKILGSPWGLAAAIWGIGECWFKRAVSIPLKTGNAEIGEIAAGGRFL